MSKPIVLSQGEKDRLDRILNCEDLLPVRNMAIAFVLVGFVCLVTLCTIALPPNLFRATFTGAIAAFVICIIKIGHYQLFRLLQYLAKTNRTEP